MKLVTEGAAGSLFRTGNVDVVCVGADRVAANGDVANKVGTYNLAVFARAHGAKFVVAAPSSTMDLSLMDGTGIPIENRPSNEITAFRGQPIAPTGVPAHNPSFDVTPAELVDAIVSEKGIIRSPDTDKMRSMFG